MTQSFLLMELVGPASPELLKILTSVLCWTRSLEICRSSSTTRLRMISQSGVSGLVRSALTSLSVKPAFL